VPVPAAPAAGSTSSGELDPLDQQVVDALQQRPSFANVSAGDLIAITHAQCGALQRGATGSDVVSIATNNGVSYDDAVYALRVSIAAYCGDDAAQASR
jgi:mannitol/fructose-specific phosphotransferase system IIA component